MQSIYCIHILAFGCGFARVIFFLDESDKMFLYYCARENERWDFPNGTRVRSSEIIRFIKKLWGFLNYFNCSLITHTFWPSLLVNHFHITNHKGLSYVNEIYVVTMLQVSTHFIYEPNLRCNNVTSHYEFHIWTLSTS